MSRPRDGDALPLQWNNLLPTRLPIRLPLRTRGVLSPAFTRALNMPRRLLVPAAVGLSYFMPTLPLLPGGER